MNRRRFLAASAATVAAGPLLLGTEDKAGAKLPTVGQGEHTYECRHGWGTLPDGLEWQTTHNVCIDSAGLVYITHQGVRLKAVDTVFVFEPNGKFVRSFGKAWHGGGHGIDVRKEGSEEFLYLCNTWKSPKVVKATLKGETVWVKERPAGKEYADPKADYNPTNVAFSPDGGFFVGDGYGSNYMLKYDAKGELVRVFGGKGKGPGQFETPHGNWVDTRDPKNPTLVVCDRANARLQTFTLDGDFVSTSEPKTVLFPANIDTRGKLMLVPDLYARVTILGADNAVVVHLGDDAEWRKKVLGMKVRTQPKEWPAGKFVHPHDACFDAAGNIFVAEWVDGGRVTFLKKVG